MGREPVKTMGGFARIGVADFADAVELFAPALELGFDRAQIGGRNEQDHAHAEIESAQQLVAFDLAELGKIGKIGSTGQEPSSITAWVLRGSTRGRLPGMPPPVMCAMPEDQPWATIFLSSGQ